jgi:hypothetical protein
MVEATREALRAADIHTTGAEPPIIGSFFQRIRAWARTDDAHRLAADLRRAAELRALDAAQAAVNAQQSDAVCRLIESLATAKSEEAVIQIGSLLLIKVDGCVSVRELTSQEIHYLRSRPQLIQKPRALLCELQLGSADLAILDPPRPTALRGPSRTWEARDPPHLDVGVQR